MKKHLTYANVVATLALFIAVAGGSALAAGKLNGKQLKPKSVGTKAIANGAITSQKLGTYAVTANAIAPNVVGAEQLKGVIVVTASNPPFGEVQCPPNSQIETGGATVSPPTDALVGSGPAGTTGWGAGATGGGTVNVTAICVPN